MLAWIPLSLIHLIAFAATPAPSFELRILNVGEGQAVLAHLGDRGVLIDTGNFAAASQTVRAIRAAGVRELDFVILTHLHPDHASGLFRVLEEFPRATLRENCQPLDLKTRGNLEPAIRWVGEHLASLPSTRCLKAGDAVEWEDARFKVLSPSKIVGADLNRNSLVIQVEWGKATALIMGDAPREVEVALRGHPAIRTGPAIFVAGHHGAADAGDAGFLNWLKPQTTVLSVNLANHWGYPAPETLMTLRKFSREVLKTGEDGEICRRLDRQRTKATACATRAEVGRNFW